MTQTLFQITLVVDDYDRAITYYTQTLGFQLVEDTDRGGGKRWVVVRPRGGDDGCTLLLAKAKNDRQAAAVGNQTGGRVSFFLYTDDFMRDYEAYRARGVEFIREPERMPYGLVSVFRDIYGNLWDLIEPPAGAAGE